MRKLAIAMALASTAIASPALARNDAWYVGVDGGVMLVEDMDLDITSGATKFKDAATIDHDKGFDAGGVIGYDFGGFRLEAESSYREVGADAGLLRAVSGTVGRGGQRAVLFRAGRVEFGAGRRVRVGYGDM